MYFLRFLRTGSWLVPKQLSRVRNWAQEQKGRPFRSTPRVIPVGISQYRIGWMVSPCSKPVHGRSERKVSLLRLRRISREYSTDLAKTRRHPCNAWHRVFLVIFSRRVSGSSFTRTGLGG